MPEAKPVTVLAPVMTPQELRAHIARRVPVVEARRDRVMMRMEGAMGLEPVALPPPSEACGAYLLNRTCYDIMQAARAGRRGYDLVRRDYAQEIECCRPLLRQVITEGRSRGLKDPELRQWTYLMMTPLTTGGARPSEAAWEAVQVQNWWERQRGWSNLAQVWRGTSPTMRQMIVRWMTALPIGDEELVLEP